MKKTLLIFDVDGTLVHSNKVDSQCFADTYLDVYGLPFPSIDWQTYPHVTDNTIFRHVIRNQFNREATLSEIESFTDQFVELLKEKRAVSPQDFYEVPFAKRLIDNLLEDDRFAIGIGTGGWMRPAQLKLDFVDIPHQRIYMAAADNKITREEIIAESIEKAKKEVDFSDIVYIGDARWDVRTTRNLNMKFIGIRRNGDLDFLHNMGVKHVLQDYADHDKFLEMVKNALPPSTI